MFRSRYTSIKAKPSNGSRAYVLNLIVNVFVVAMRSYVVGTRSALEQRASREVITLTEAHDSPVMTFDIARRLDPKLAHTLHQERLAHNEDKEVSVHTNAQVQSMALR